ncbi:MAG: hypothetical protein IJ282_10635 [Lachnospiraceae bacterium]|nr:hypothetical protein [Lachnospiraceae bacterium]
MNKLTNLLYNASLQIIKYMGFGLMAFLFISGLLFTCYALDMESQLVLTRMDNLLLSFIWLALFLVLLYFFFKPALKNPAKTKKILLGVCFFWYVFAGIVLILFSKTVPAADAWSTYSIALELAQGNTGVIHPTDSYLSYYPQQIGLVAYYEIIIRAWRLLFPSVHAYHLLKCINLGWACIIVLFQYKSVKILFHNDKADIIYLLLSLFHFPMLLYTSFVYGEIPSFALFSIGLWALLVLFQSTRPAKKKLVLLSLISIFAFSGAVMLRKNTLVLMIAVVIVTFLEWIRRKKGLFLLLAVVFALTSCLSLPALQSFYEYRADNTLKSGVPPMSYFAMGMQESSRANGWYNGFNFYTYQETGMDTELTNELSKAAISQRLDYFSENPGYALTFYKDKIFSQWIDGSYASRQATLATFGGRSAFFLELYEGKYSMLFIEWCNVLQNIVYLGAFFFCFLQIKKKSPNTNMGLPVYLCLIGVLGGFLFHLIWEANSRYIFTYGLLLLPYAASGISSLIQSWEDGGLG